MNQGGPLAQRFLYAVRSPTIKCGTLLRFPLFFAKSLPLKISFCDQSMARASKSFAPAPWQSRIAYVPRAESNMAKPILLSVDDDSDVLRAIERDLRSHYGAEYRVIGSDSPEGALDLLKQLKVRNDSVALLLADQRMPRMDGVEFLQQAMGIFPSAKRALLTAYSATNAAFGAINQGSLNFF